MTPDSPDGSVGAYPIAAKLSGGGIEEVFIVNDRAEPARGPLHWFDRVTSILVGRRLGPKKE